MRRLPWNFGLRASGVPALAITPWAQSVWAMALLVQPVILVSLYENPAPSVRPDIGRAEMSPSTPLTRPLARLPTKVWLEMFWSNAAIWMFFQSTM